MKIGDFRWVGLVVLVYIEKASIKEEPNCWANWVPIWTKSHPDYK